MKRSSPPQKADPHLDEYRTYVRYSFQCPPLQQPQVARPVAVRRRRQPPATVAAPLKIEPTPATQPASVALVTLMTLVTWLNWLVV